MPQRPNPWQIGVALAAGTLVAGLAARYPLAPGLVLALLLAYGWALWRWPMLWLAAVPAALPSFDLAPWSGWTFVEESDFVVLASIAVLAIRAPPGRADFRLGGWAGAAVALAAAAVLVGATLGLVRPGPAGGTAIAELSRLNALRVAKGFAIALALLPFLRRAFRERADAGLRLAGGMAAGLALVAAATMAERAVFTGPFDFRVIYRVVGTFSSMHFGGGYVGVYVAMALPFLFVLRPRRVWSGLAVVLVGAGALYTLVVTFARAAYASTVVSSLVVAAARTLAAVRGREGIAALALPVVLLLAVGGVIATASQDARVMVRRIDHLMPDLAVRRAQWRAGLALRDAGPGTDLFGMGLGSYARVVLERRRQRAPGNLVLGTDDGRPFLRVSAGLPLYLGQKVFIAPRQLYRISVALRAPVVGADLVVLMCEKLLLYSGNCRDITFAPRAAGRWENFEDILSSFGLAERSVFGLGRPVELSLLVPEPGTSLDIADLRLTDEDGHQHIVNGDFARGLDRWLPTDDDHAVWRIENQYLMTLFEGGALGVAAFLALAAAALAAALRATRRGDAVAPALAASICAVLGSALFDCPLEVPRLAALYHIVIFAALALDAAGRRIDAPGGGA